MIEAAFFSAPLSKVRVLKEQKKRGAEKLLEIKENMHRPITVVVVLNNIFNIVGSMMVGLTVVDILGNHWLGFSCFHFLDCSSQ